MAGQASHQFSAPIPSDERQGNRVAEKKTMNEETSVDRNSGSPACSPPCSICGETECDVESCDLCNKIVCDNCCEWSHDEDDYDNGQTVCSECESALPIRGEYDDPEFDPECDPVGSCENCGTNLYSGDDERLCDQCEWSASQ